MEIMEKEWDLSYQKGDNFVFYPHEEIIRFISKFIKKRIGLFEFELLSKCEEPIKGLDLGCGIGRHIIYLEGMGIDAYGIDLSTNAIKLAQKWANEEKIRDIERKIVVGDIQNLIWENNYFHFVISHGVLDSMYFEVAIKAIKEVHRVLIPKGLFYLDLVSGDDSAHSREYADEEIVSNELEKGTIQSYYNYTKIQKLIESNFIIREINLIKRENILSGISTARYHLVLEKILFN
ncbi:Methyltransferase domain protein [anaerobic digester metagenome]